MFLQGNEKSIRTNRMRKYTYFHSLPAMSFQLTLHALLYAPGDVQSLSFPVGSHDQFSKFGNITNKKGSVKSNRASNAYCYGMHDNEGPKRLFRNGKWIPNSPILFCSWLDDGPIIWMLSAPSHFEDMQDQQISYPQPSRLSSHKLKDSITATHRSHRRDRLLITTGWRSTMKF